MKTVKSRALRERRHRRIRTRVVGTSERPRLSIFRSTRHMFAQIIDDSKGHTLVAASTLDTEVRARAKEWNKRDEAKAVGKLIAQRAIAKGVKQVVFDRGGNLYHGRVQALAEGSREAGLEF
jgi:large subunit ribosomal protein L18